MCGFVIAVGLSSRVLPLVRNRSWLYGPVLGFLSRHCFVSDTVGDRDNGWIHGKRRHLITSNEKIGE